MTAPSSFRLRGKSGFSLVELLVVLAIIAILSALTLPALSSLSRSENLTDAGQLVLDQMTQARQLAAAYNENVEVRFLQTGGTGSGYQAIQLWTTDSSGNSVAAAKAVKLPDGMIVSQDTNLSQIFSLSPGPPKELPSTAGIWANTPYMAYTIRPSGAIDPTPDSGNRSKLNVTVLSSRDTAAGNPKNYMTIQMNPDSGTTLTYRP